MVDKFDCIYSKLNYPHFFSKLHHQFIMFKIEIVRILASWLLLLFLKRERKNTSIIAYVVQQGYLYLIHYITNLGCLREHIVSLNESGLVQPVEILSKVLLNILLQNRAILILSALRSLVFWEKLANFQLWILNK